MLFRSYSNDDGDIITGYKVKEKYINCACYIKEVEYKQKCIFNLSNMHFCDYGAPFTIKSIKNTIENAYKCPITIDDVDSFFNTDKFGDKNTDKFGNIYR